MKPGYLALYSYKYKAEKFVNYFCINLNRGGSFVSSFHCTVQCWSNSFSVTFCINAWNFHVNGRAFELWTNELWLVNGILSYGLIHYDLWIYYNIWTFELWTFELRTYGRILMDRIPESLGGRSVIPLAITQVKDVWNTWIWKQSLCPKLDYIVSFQ